MINLLSTTPEGDPSGDAKGGRNKVFIFDRTLKKMMTSINTVQPTRPLGGSRCDMTASHAATASKTIGLGILLLGSVNRTE